MSVTRRTLGRAGLVRELERAAGIERASHRLVLSCVVPPWLAAGVLDWDGDGRTHIEADAGLT